MRLLLALLVLACCLARGNGIFKHLKLGLKPQIQPSYKTVKYVAPTVLLAAPLPETYARRVPTYTSHLSTYSVSLPSVGTYGLPQVHESIYAAPVVYAAPYVYDRPETMYFEEHYHEHYDK